MTELLSAVAKMFDQISPCNPVNLREVLITFLYSLVIVVLFTFSWKNLWHDHKVIICQ